MDGWITFWKILLLCCLFSYFLLAIVIGIGGFFNIKDFIKDLGSPEQEE